MAGKLTPRSLTDLTSQNSEPAEAPSGQPKPSDRRETTRAKASC